MKKILFLPTIMLVVFLSACEAKSDESNEPVSPAMIENTTSVQTVEQQTTAETQTVSPETQPVPSEPYVSPFEFAKMPNPFKVMDGDGNRDFAERYDIKLAYTSTISDKFVEYLDCSTTEFIAVCEEKWGNSYWNGVGKSNLMETHNLFSAIIEFNIPDEVVIESIKDNNESYGDLFEQLNDERYREAIFSDEDIAVLLSRDEVLATAQFAEDTAIVIEERAYSPYWLYCHVPEEYSDEGITPEMIEEKLDLYAKFGFTDEADIAFSKKLSEFIGREISLKQIRDDNAVNQ